VTAAQTLFTLSIGVDHDDDHTFGGLQFEDCHSRTVTVLNSIDPLTLSRVRDLEDEDVLYLHFPQLLLSLKRVSKLFWSMHNAPCDGNNLNHLKLAQV
jgi:hypothetical protein